MDVIDGLIISFVAAVTLPTLLDLKVFKTRQPWWRVSLSYFTMVCGCMIIPLLLNDFTNVWFDWFAPALAIIAASFISMITIPSVIIVLFFTTVLFPFTVLYQIAIHNSVQEPVRFILERLEWQFLLPIFLGLVASILMTRIIPSARAEG